MDELDELEGYLEGYSNLTGGRRYIKRKCAANTISGKPCQQQGLFVVGKFCYCRRHAGMAKKNKLPQQPE